EAAATVDEPDTHRRQRRPERACGLRIGWIPAAARSAVDADVGDCCSGCGPVGCGHRPLGRATRLLAADFFLHSRIDFPRLAAPSRYGLWRPSSIASLAPACARHGAGPATVAEILGLALGRKWGAVEL